MIILIAGGSCSGKSFISEQIKNRYPGSSIISQDWYYKNKTWENPAELERLDALDIELLRCHLRDLVNKGHCASPIYDFVSSSRKKERRLIKLQPLLIIEGLYSFIIEDFCLAFQRPLLKLFVSAPEKLMILRRIHRDVSRKKKTVADIEKNFQQIVLPAFKEHIEPQKSQADLVVRNSEQAPPDLKELWKWLDKHSQDSLS